MQGTSWRHLVTHHPLYAYCPPNTDGSQRNFGSCPIIRAGLLRLLPARVPASRHPPIQSSSVWSSSAWPSICRHFDASPLACKIVRPCFWHNATTEKPKYAPWRSTQANHAHPNRPYLSTKHPNSTQGILSLLAPEPIYPILPSVPAKAGASGMIHPYPNQPSYPEKKRQRIASSARRISLV